MTTDQEPRVKKRGRPAKLIEPIPDTFENVVKALVQPAKSSSKKDEA